MYLIHTQIHDYTNININKYTFAYIFLILNQRRNLGAHFTPIVIASRDARGSLFLLRDGAGKKKNFGVGQGRE